MICVIFMTVFTVASPFRCLPRQRHCRPFYGECFVSAASSARGLTTGSETLTTAYAAESCPINLRGLLASFVNMAWLFGLLLQASVGRATLGMQSNWGKQVTRPNISPLTGPAWLGVFYTVYNGSGRFHWVCVAANLRPRVSHILSCDPSADAGCQGPWWLVRKGRLGEAKVSLMRVINPGHCDGRKVDAYVAYIKHVDDIERAEAKKRSSLEMFTGTNLRRTEIVSQSINLALCSAAQMAGVWLIQTWSGQGIEVLMVQL